MQWQSSETEEAQRLCITSGIFVTNSSARFVELRDGILVGWWTDGGSLFQMIFPIAIVINVFNAASTMQDGYSSRIICTK